LKSSPARLIEWRAVALALKPASEKQVVGLLIAERTDHLFPSSRIVEHHDQLDRRQLRGTVWLLAAVIGRDDVVRNEWRSGYRESSSYLHGITVSDKKLRLAAKRTFSPMVS
jgi:hypothetical protein